MCQVIKNDLVWVKEQQLFNMVGFSFECISCWHILTLGSQIRAVIGWMWAALEKIPTRDFQTEREIPLGSDRALELKTRHECLYWREKSGCSAKGGQGPVIIKDWNSVLFNRNFVAGLLRHFVSVMANLGKDELNCLSMKSTDTRSFLWIFSVSSNSPRLESLDL